MKEEILIGKLNFK